MYDTQKNAVGSMVFDSQSASLSRRSSILGEGEQIHFLAESIIERVFEEILEQTVNTTLNVVLEPYHVYSHPINLDFTLEELRNSLKLSLHSDYCDWNLGTSTLLSHINRFLPVNQKFAVERFITTIFRRTCVVVSTSTDIFSAMISGIPQVSNTTYSLNSCSVTDVIPTTGQYKQPPGTTRPSWLGGNAGRQQLYLLRGAPDFGLSINGSLISTNCAMEETIDGTYAS